MFICVPREPLAVTGWRHSSPAHALVFTLLLLDFANASVKHLEHKQRRTTRCNFISAQRPNPLRAPPPFSPTPAVLPLSYSSSSSSSLHLVTRLLSQLLSLLVLCSFLLDTHSLTPPSKEKRKAATTTKKSKDTLCQRVRACAHQFTFNHPP